MYTTLISVHICSFTDWMAVDAHDTFAVLLMIFSRINPFYVFGPELVRILKTVDFESVTQATVTESRGALGH